jgi:hypothetical protein
MQANKPPPPIRRTSSITNASGTNQPTSMGSLENLPPPPAFLLEPTAQQQQKPHTGIKVAETVKALTELKHTPASPNSVRRTSASSQSIYQTHGGNAAPQPQQGPLLSTFQSQTKVSYVSQSGGVVYAQPSQILGGSPAAARRANSFRSQSADRKSGPVGVGSNFIASLSAKLAPNLSPRTARRHSEDSVQSPPIKLGQRGPGQSFLDSLNAKLAQQHITNNSTQMAQHKANKIRQIINSKAQPDPKVCHESLMDQIKRGATLKRAKVINDRSAPKIY